jgi:hypothetical protein
MVGWGGGDDHTVTRYETPAALAAAKNSSWANLQVVGVVPGKAIANVHAAPSSDSVAVPLPSDIAQAVGKPAGTKHIGTFD